MKKYFFLGLFLILIFPTMALSDTVQTENANVQNSVTTTTNGANCTTHIQTTVNGQTEVLNSNDCGTNTLNNSVSGTVTKELSPSPAVTKPVLKYPMITVSQIPSSTPTPRIIEKNNLHNWSLSIVIKGVEDFFKRFFHAL